MKPRAPAKPTGIQAAAVSSRQIDLHWTPSPDNEGVTAYLVERREKNFRDLPFALVAHVSVASFADGKLFSETSYCYRLRALDGAGRMSARSGETKATTLKRLPQLREWWDRIQVIIARNPTNIDVETMCQFKAMSAGLDLAAANKLPANCGKGWNLACDLVMEGYLAAKAAAPRFKASIGDLGGFLYETAKPAILNAALEQYADTGKREHRSKADRAQNINKATWALKIRSGLNETDRGVTPASVGMELAQGATDMMALRLNPGSVTVPDMAPASRPVNLPPSEGRVPDVLITPADYADIDSSPIKAGDDIAAASQQQLVATVRNVVSILGPQDQDIIDMRFGVTSGKPMTLNALAARVGIPPSTLDRRITKEMLPKLREAAHKLP
jgi:RNA polymerase sigma factor (sigma-70 family)